MEWPPAIWAEASLDPQVAPSHDEGWARRAPQDLCSLELLPKTRPGPHGAGEGHVQYLEGLLGQGAGHGGRTLPVYSIYVSLQMCTFPSTYLCKDLRQGVIWENDRRERQKKKTLLLPLRPPTLGTLAKPSSRAQVLPPPITHAHTHCMFRGQKCHPVKQQSPKALSCSGDAQSLRKS